MMLGWMSAGMAVCGVGVLILIVSLIFFFTNRPLKPPPLPPDF